MTPDDAARFARACVVPRVVRDAAPLWDALLERATAEQAAVLAAFAAGDVVSGIEFGAPLGAPDGPARTAELAVGSAYAAARLSLLDGPTARALDRRSQANKALATAETLLVRLGDELGVGRAAWAETVAAVRVRWDEVLRERRHG